MGLTLNTIVTTFRRWWLLLLLVPAVTGAATYAFGMSRTPMYASTATLLVSIPSSVTLDDYNANLLAEDLTTTYQTLVTTDPVLQAVAKSVSPAITVDELRDRTTVSSSTGALFEITVVDADPARAADLVNSMTDELTEFVGGLSKSETVDYPGTITTVVRGAEPADPYAPRLPAYLVLGVIAGMLISSVVVMLFERLDTKVRANTDLAALTGLLRLADIPSLKRPATGVETVFLDDPNTHLASESIRTVRNAIVANDHASRKSLIVSSVNRGDGKTFVAANLAEAIARAGKLVLLIDANLRHPRLHTIYDLQNDDGLGNLLAAPELDWQSAAVRISPNLAVLPAGTTSEQPSDVLLSTEFDQLIERMLTLADIVIIDTPSIVAGSDAIAAATHGSDVLMVCRTANTRIPDLRLSRVAFEDAGASVLGVVVNRGRWNRPDLRVPRLRFWRRASSKSPLNPPFSQAPAQPRATNAS